MSYAQDGNRLPPVILSFAFLLASSTMAATKSDKSDREMLRLMEFLREMEMLKQMNMLQDLHHRENAAGQVKTSAPQKTTPVKKKEITK